MMERYYFHIHVVNGVTEKDVIGAEFKSPHDAIIEARALADEIVRDAEGAGERLIIIVEVTDSSGRTLSRIDATAGGGSVEVASRADSR